MADFYLDHNVALELAHLLSSYGHSAITARDLGLEHAQDDEHLLVAAQRGWILVTHNRKDFMLLHNAWQRWTSAWQVQERHAGILIMPGQWLAPQSARETASSQSRADPRSRRAGVLQTFLLDEQASFGIILT